MTWQPQMCWDASLVEWGFCKHPQGVVCCESFFLFYYLIFSPSLILNSLCSFCCHGGSRTSYSECRLMPMLNHFDVLIKINVRVRSVWNQIQAKGFDHFGHCWTWNIIHCIQNEKKYIKRILVYITTEVKKVKVYFWLCKGNILFSKVQSLQKCLIRKMRCHRDIRPLLISSV